ncbi:co-chaperone YbbN [Streptomyces sp. NBC_00091]|uniref:thioredoxin family protein n=1 Tax=Streptomyces sp. NBC_00091 TaxID=2975648 RepID=UPI0022539213|nr:thioredoxin domain-containing protein [Streptomyces sp. NBC_00091]MCX5380020.1 thioredoxin domain-containing protein [Streptomyces sp. NBC_00091]
MARRVHRPLEDQEFDFIVGMAQDPVLAYFTGTWPKAAAACRVLDDLVAELVRGQEYGTRLTAIRTDITRCPGPTRRYGVTGAPTVVLLRSGEAVATHAGPMDMAELRAFLDAHL